MEKKEENKETETSKRHIFVDIFIVILIICFGAYFYGRYVEPEKLIVKEYKVASENIPSNFSGIKIIHFSDLYYGNTTDMKNVDNIVNKMNKLNPDIVVFTGNLISKSMSESETIELVSKLSKINATLGKYSVKGNIDYDNNYDAVMTESGFKILNNEYELIYNEGLMPIYLCGFVSSLKEELNYESCLGYFKNTEESVYIPTYKVVLTHEGDAITKILEYDNTVDLILGGNSLNGSILVPYYGQLFLPKGSLEYYAPYYKEGNTNIYISSGIGTDKYPYRINNKPSFNLYRLKSL